MKAKPNISTLAAGANALSLIKKTASWIQNCDLELTSVVSDARKSVNSEREMFQRLIVLGVTPYWQYFSHTTAVVPKKKKGNTNAKKTEQTRGIPKETQDEKVSLRPA